MLAPPVALWLSSVPCVLAAIGCNRAATFTQPIPAVAAIHWVHAVPDTMQEDFRVVDIVSNAGLFDQDFRGSNMFYQGIEAGTRRVRIFNNRPGPVVAQQVLIDTSFTLTPPSNYTLIHIGFAPNRRTAAR